MSRHTSAFAVGLAPLVVATSVLAARAPATGTLPVSPTFLNASSAHGGLQVEPATIAYTGDGTGFLGGANVRHQSSGISWTQWTTHAALGTGFNQLDDCSPSCASGNFRSYLVKIELWRPRRLGPMLAFTRMTIFYRQSRPRHMPAHYTFTDTYTPGTGGGYSWGPPSALGYCIRTYGLKPAAGCKNIHSLP